MIQKCNGFQPRELGKKLGSKVENFDLKHYDMYGVIPSYKLPAYRSWLGFVATVLTTILFISYVALTLHDYITKPPELVIQGHLSVDGESFPAPSKIAVSVEYQDANGTKHHLEGLNNDSYFRISAHYVTIRNQDRVPREKVSLPLTSCGDGEVCIDQVVTERLLLTGAYESEEYQYIEINILGCRDVPNITYSDCVEQDAIEEAIQSKTKVQILMTTQWFDPNLYPKKEAVSSREKSQRFYLVSPLTFRNEVYLQGRSIDHERPHVGSPPLPEFNTRILSFDRVEERLAPKTKEDGAPCIAFFIRLSEYLSKEETSYWTPGILDLFGMWGAIFSFLTSLSIGLVATTYNQYRSDKSFRKRGGKDVRLYDRRDFDNNGRLKPKAEEEKIPTSVFGQLRFFAEQEHNRKEKASKLLISALQKRVHIAKCKKTSETIDTLQTIDEVQDNELNRL